MTVDAAWSLSRSLRRRGAVVLAPFALLWALVAISGLPADWRWAARAAALLLTVGAGLLALAPTPPDLPERVRSQPAGWHRRVGAVNLAEVVGIVVSVVALPALDRPELVPPAVSLVVGLHFVPLARLFDQPKYRGTAAGLVLAAAAGLVVLLLDGSRPVSRVVVGTSAAATLWATSLLLSAPTWVAGRAGRPTG